jgi:RNA polymerase sigma-70 factor (ECF subfamily)
MTADASARDWPVVDNADVAAAHGGDHAAFERLYLALDDCLRAYVFHRFCTVPALDLDGTMAEVWCRAWRKRSCFTGRTAASYIAWLRSIARNLVVDDHRREERHRRLVRRLGLLSAFEVEPDIAPGVNDRDEVDRAMRALPADDRELLYMEYGEGRSRGEIAVLLDVPVGTVDSRLHRARGLFRVALASKRGGDDE